MSIPVPKLLNAGVAKMLNNKFVASCKIFPFMHICDRLILDKPVSYTDALVIYSCGLYTLYHDYACEFLNYILDSEFNPTNTDGVVYSIVRIHEHIKAVNNMRSLIAHGHIGINTPNKYQMSSYKKLLTDSGLTFIPMEKLKESDCISIVNFITNESDYLYNFLDAFIVQFSTVSACHQNIADKFLDNAWEKSIVNPRVFKIVSDDIRKFSDNLTDVENSKLKALNKAISKKISLTDTQSDMLKFAIQEMKEAAVNTAYPIASPDELYSIFIKILHHEITKKKSPLSYVTSNSSKITAGT